MKHRAIALALACLLLMLAGCATIPQQPATPPLTRGTVTVTFDFERQSGYASNQFAVWIAHMDGTLVKTLCATEFTAKGGYKTRPGSIGTWVGKAMGVSDFDAVATATPKRDVEFTCTWDGTDEAGNAVPMGRYWFIVEGTLRWSNRVLYSGQIEIGRKNTVVEAERQFTFVDEGKNPALDEDAPECGMITNVRAEYTA